MATKKEKEITLYLEASEVEYKDGRKTKKFIAFKTKIGKLNMDVRFTKEAEENGSVPTVSGYYKLPVSHANLDTRGDYPVLWVRE